jgi:hypothetical protein
MTFGLLKALTLLLKKYDFYSIYKIVRKYVFLTYFNALERFVLGLIKLLQFSFLRSKMLVKNNFIVFEPGKFFFTLA